MWGQPAGSTQDEAEIIGAGLAPHEDDRESRHLLPPVDAVGDPPTSIYGLVAAWSDDHAIFYGGYPRSVGLAYHPDRRRPWQQLPARLARVNAVAAWTGSELLLWGGYTTTGPEVDLWTYCPTVSTALPCRIEQATPAEAS